MTFKNSDEFKQQKMQRVLEKTFSNNHIFQNGNYITKKSSLCIFCNTHNVLHKTTFENYLWSRNGLPCCGNEKKSKKLKQRVFSACTIQRMRQSAKTRPNKGAISKKHPKYWRRTPQYRDWEKKIKHYWNNECAVPGVKTNLRCHHFYSFSKTHSFPYQTLLRYDCQNGILLHEPIHVLFHNSFGYTNTTLDQFLLFLKDLLSLSTMPISSQARQECREGSETRVYDPERVMKLHERLEKIQQRYFLWYSPTLQRNLENKR